MTKIIVVLIVAAVIESVGVAFLGGGLKEINGPGRSAPAKLPGSSKAARPMARFLPASGWKLCFLAACFT